MRRELRGIYCLLLMPLLLGMGGRGGGPASDSIPRPKENYSADLLDRQGVTTRVTSLSCNGRTFFPLERGEGILMVPFGKVSRVKLDLDNSSRVDAAIQVPGVQPLEGKLPRSLLCTGATDYGNYQVEIRGLAEIIFVRQ